MAIPDRNTLNLLIADDHSDILEELTHFLTQEKHQVFEARNGVDALRLFQEHAIDGVFGALTMPKMGGIELLKELKTIDATIPFVIISRHSETENILNSLHLGACDFLTKPLQESDLHRSLNKIMTLREDSKFSNYCIEHSVSESHVLELKNDFEYINRIVAFATRNLPAYGIIEPEDMFTVNMVLGEAIENAIFHGNLEISSDLKKERFERFREEGEYRREAEPYKHRRVYISYEINCHSVRYVIRDEGRGFDHTNIPDPRDPQNLFKVSGRGILLIMNFMDEVFWNDRGNEVTMVRYRRRRKRPLQGSNGGEV